MIKILWQKSFHDDHMAFIRILPKLEGNLKDIEYGEAGENVIWELLEFAELIKTVLIPHFREEEKSIYPRAFTGDEESSRYMAGMYNDHKVLYEAFNGFIKSLEGNNIKGQDLDCGKSPANIILKSRNIDKREVPKNLDRPATLRKFEDSFDKGEILKHGFNIIKVLMRHVEKEETTLLELIKKADEVGKNKRKGREAPS